MPRTIDPVIGMDEALKSKVLREYRYMKANFLSASEHEASMARLDTPAIRAEKARRVHAMLDHAPVKVSPQVRQTFVDHNQGHIEESTFERPFVKALPLHERYQLMEHIKAQARQHQVYPHHWQLLKLPDEEEKVLSQKYDESKARAFKKAEAALRGPSQKKQRVNKDAVENDEPQTPLRETCALFGRNGANSYSAARWLQDARSRHIDQDAADAFMRNPLNGMDPGLRRRLLAQQRHRAQNYMKWNGEEWNAFHYRPDTPAEIAEKQRRVHLLLDSAPVNVPEAARAHLTAERQLDDIDAMHLQYGGELQNHMSRGDREALADHYDRLNQIHSVYPFARDLVRLPREEQQRLEDLGHAEHAAAQGRRPIFLSAQQASAFLGRFAASSSSAARPLGETVEHELGDPAVSAFLRDPTHGMDPRLRADVLDRERYRARNFHGLNNPEQWRVLARPDGPAEIAEKQRRIHLLLDSASGSVNVPPAVRAHLTQNNDRLSDINASRFLTDGFLKIHTSQEEREKLANHYQQVAGNHEVFPFGPELAKLPREEHDRLAGAGLREWQARVETLSPTRLEHESEHLLPVYRYDGRSPPRSPTSSAALRRRPKRAFYKKQSRSPSSSPEGGHMLPPRTG
ncbi:hypothetical protein CBOM_04437 [Ceraceosorus bombacis]|uniref:Uncharacterized protein n=1 Tax=Ceraceosorus bombacis TaxID=401625 RepID=A0A0P1BNH5_9BASI|nr:hypothetical protein CBOM_04437 [Ceraceosorus bombacis]